MEAIGITSPVTIGLVFAIVGVIGGQVIMYTRTMTRLETEGKAFRDRFNDHATRLEGEVSGVRVEIAGLRKELSGTILDTARQRVMVDQLQRTTENLDMRLVDLEKGSGKWGSGGGYRGGGDAQET